MRLLHLITALIHSLVYNSIILIFISTSTNCNSFCFLDNAICYGFNGVIANSSTLSISQNNTGTIGRYREGTTITYACNNGYAPLDGINTVHCTHNGLWYPNSPKCAGRPLHDICNSSPCYIFTYMFIQYVCMSSSFLVACPALQAPSHSTLSGTATYPGVVILVQCDTGYTLKGIANVTCLVNGSWNHALPSCQQGKTTCYYITLHCQWLCA